MSADLVCDTCGKPKTSTTAAVVYRVAGTPEAPIMVRKVVCNECNNPAVRENLHRNIQGLDRSKLISPYETRRHEFGFLERRKRPGKPCTGGF